MASDESALLVHSGDWPASPPDPSCSPSTNHLRLTVPAYPTSHDRLMFHSDPAPPQSNVAISDRGESPVDAASSALDVFTHQGDIGPAPSTIPFMAPPLYPFQEASMTMGMQSIPMQVQAADTISPLQTRFDIQNSPPHLKEESSLDSNGYSATSSLSNLWDPPSGTGKTRRSSSISLHSEPDPAPTKAASRRRRRPSESVEPGSARAIYLEKNRKAATKCRTKQKHQQEQLVETARVAERKNKALKVEVELLKGDMRDLMELVGQHTECPDNRLQRYVQREADRLAMGQERGDEDDKEMGDAA